MIRGLAAGCLLLALPGMASAAGWKCWATASQRYGVPVQLLYSIARVETGNGAHVIHRNGNGTYDIGLMQINSTWLPKLSHYGITANKLLRDPCLNLQVGAWILAQSIQKHGLNWRGVGAYNAGTDKLRARYAGKVVKQLRIVEAEGYAEVRASH